MSAGDVLGIDLMAGPERAQWVVTQAGDGADSLAASPRIMSNLIFRLRDDACR